jgi:hypothetical protein
MMKTLHKPHLHGADLTDSMEKARLEREAAGATLAEQTAAANAAVIADRRPGSVGAQTYVLLVLVADFYHVYGPPTTNRNGLIAVGQDLAAKSHAETWHVLPVEQAPVNLPVATTHE